MRPPEPVSPDPNREMPGVSPRRPMRGFVSLLSEQGALFVFLIGMAVCGFGLWSLSPPWAFIFVGLLFMLLAVGAEIRSNS